jgi:hypothetical protein
VATQVPLPARKQRFDLKVHLHRLGLGLLPFLVLASPFIAGMTSYEIAKMSGSSSPLLWGKRFGFGCLYFFLIAFPVYMLGKALQLSRTHESKSPENLAGAAMSATASTSVETLGELNNDQLIDIWKTSIDVQQHFNDLELRIRNFAVTLLVAVVGATAFSLKERYIVSIGGITFPLAVSVLCAGIVGWLAFYFMDMHWYHRLLLGSVKHTVKIEKDRDANQPELGLSRAIGKESPWPLWGMFNIHSSEKITLFYAAGFSLLAILTVMVLVATPSTVPDASVNGSQSEQAKGKASSPTVSPKQADTEKENADPSSTSNSAPTKTRGAESARHPETAPSKQ